MTHQLYPVYISANAPTSSPNRITRDSDPWLVSVVHLVQCFTTQAHADEAVRALIEHGWKAWAAEPVGVYSR